MVSVGFFTPHKYFAKPQGFGQSQFWFFLNCYLAATRPALGHSQGDKCHMEPRNEVGALSPAERLTYLRWQKIEDDVRNILKSLYQVERKNLDMYSAINTTK